MVHLAARLITAGTADSKVTSKFLLKCLYTPLSYTPLSYTPN